MVDRSLPHIWSMRIGFLVLAALIIFFHLIPLETTPRRWAPPDLLVALIFAWVLRRPDYVPALTVAGVMLMADLMFQRPPGLMALLVVLATEYLKNQQSGQGEAGFVGEWAAVSVALVAITLANRLVLGLLMVPLPPLTLSLIQMLLTVVVYPLAVLVSQIVFGVRRPAPIEGSLGGRA